MYLNTNKNTFGKYLNTITNTLYNLNMIKQCMLSCTIYSSFYNVKGVTASFTD